MTYVVKECFFTLQGEGARSGTASVFCRFTGCNLWSGRPEDRATARCRFCDTDFVGTDGPGGGRFAEAEQLARHIESVWTARVPDQRQPRSVVFTGGEPTLQLDAALVSCCKALGFHVAIETNGTRPCPPGIDWICVSPKAGNPIAQRSGHELKVAWPQPGLALDDLETLAFDHRFLQPIDGPDLEANTRACIEMCMRHPRWRLGVQLHKYVGLK